ncbi:MAG TPA: hypothetical protein VG602_06525 [Actinomycetota bacterium]|nr:hypothetical protein [Actinomycetota bacterium]
MGNDLIVGTGGALYRLGAEEPELPDPVAAVSTDRDDWWALTEDGRVVRSGEQAGSLSGVRGRCILPREGDLLIGTSEARLFRLRDRSIEADRSFDQAPGRERWYTPWGGPPDTRSLAADAEGMVYANVHVGGILRGDGDGWQPTIDVDADVHQVTAFDGLVLAATAYGVAISTDRGLTWEMDEDGLHAPYCRAVAVADETLLTTASTGPFTDRAAVYRRPLAGGTFERCEGGLPEWFPSNIDTHCLVASGSAAALGTDRGEVWLSPDEGRTWDRVADGWPEIRALAFAS